MEPLAEAADPRQPPLTPVRRELIVQQTNTQTSAQRIMNHSLPQRPYWIPNADVFIAPSGDLIVCVELSGMQTDDFEINTEGTKLRITGKRRDSGIATAQDALVHEINDGPFDSVLDIPPDFDLWRLSSVYVNGTLRITVPPGPNRS
jgi:HSP20 family molecular chaperone IbpA